MIASANHIPSLCGKAGRLTYAGLAGHAEIEGIIEPYRLVRGRK
jgi:hypothetical protein